MTCVMHCDVLITIFVVLICVEAFFTTQHACVSPSQSLFESPWNRRDSDGLVEFQLCSGLSHRFSQQPGL